MRCDAASKCILDEYGERGGDGKGECRNEGEEGEKGKVLTLLITQTTIN